MNRRLNFGGDPFGEDSGGLRARVNPLGVVELAGGMPLPPVEGNYPGRRPLVEVIEPVDGWWRQQGAFGLGFNGAVPDEGEVIALTEQLKLPGPPRQWWVHWFRYNRKVAGELSSFNWELRGRITYGVGGVQNVVETDLMQGIQLAVVASSIKVDLVTYNPVPDQPYEPTAVILGAMIGDGAGAGALPATWTTPSMLVEAVDLIVDLPVPDFARSLCLHSTESNPANLLDVTLGFVTPNVAQKVVSFGRLYDALTREKGIAIPAGTNQIRLTAPVATQAGERFSLQFFLAL